jgi:hypothetical protein
LRNIFAQLIGFYICMQFDLYTRKVAADLNRIALDGKSRKRPFTVFT